MFNNNITINARKFDGSIHRSWKAELIEETVDFWVFAGMFEEQINHTSLGIIRRNTVSYEYYWKNQWFNIFRFMEPEGDFRNFYCNVSMIPAFNGNTLDYIDLDIDLVVWKDFTTEILDLSEFEENSKLFNYGDEIKEKSRQTIVELSTMIEHKLFPFDQT